MTFQLKQLAKACLLVAVAGSALEIGRAHV